MNITKLNFSDKNYKELINSYIKILIYAINIDWDINKKEVKILFSLFTRIDIEDQNEDLWKINFFHKSNTYDSKNLSIDDKHFEYLRVLDLENIIFYEWEKSLHLIISSLSKINKKDFSKKMEKLENYLISIKKIIELKKKDLGEDYIKIFYYWIYFYSKVICEQAWKLFWKKIVKEEREYLNKIKKILNVDTGEIKESLIEKIRAPILDI